MSNYYTGLGYDLHRMKKGSGIVLAGVEIPCEVSTIAHSDGDLVLHALSDALLGASGKGDIGDYFPDKEQRYKNLRSSVILDKALALIKKGYRIGNVDIVIVADYPRLLPYKGLMIRSLQRLLAVKNVNVKIKSCEGLYARKVISCYATVLLKRSK